MLNIKIERIANIKATWFKNDAAKKAPQSNERITGGLHVRFETPFVFTIYRLWVSLKPFSLKNIYMLKSGFGQLHSS